MYIISLPASGEFCGLLITFANSLGPDQARPNVGPDLDTNCLKGAQWLGGRVLDLRMRWRGRSRNLIGITALWSLSKTHLS